MEKQKSKFSMERELVRLSVPILIGMIFELICSLLDVFWIAKIDPENTAIVSGVGLAYPVAFLLVALAQGIGAGVSTIAAIAAGQKDDTAIRSAGRSGFILSAVSSMVIILLVYLFSSPLIDLMAGSELSADAKAYAAEYLGYYLPGVFFLFCAQPFLAMLQGEGKTKHIGIATSVSTGINALLDPVFIFVFGLGVKGAAITTSIAQVLLFAYVIILQLRTDKDSAPIGTHNPVDFPMIGRILKLGMPQAVSFIILSASLAAMNWFAGGVSETFMSAYTLTGRFDGILLTPTLAFSIGLSIMVGQNYGAGSIDSLKTIVKRGTVLNMLVSLAPSLVYMAVARPLFSTMSNNPDVVSLAVMQVYCVTVVSAAGSALGLSAGSALQAIENPMRSTLVMLLRMLLLPVAIVIALQLIWGAAPHFVWISTAAGSLLGGAVGYAMIRRRIARLASSPITEPSPAA